MEVEASIDAAVSTLALVGRTGRNKPERPPLELVRIAASEVGGTFQVSRFAYDVILLSDFAIENVVETLLDEVDGKMRDVDADPAAI